MRALTIRQPWAWLIVHGYKDVENRTWGTSHRGALLIHAGVGRDPYGFAVARQAGISLPDELPAGGLVGQVELVDVVASSESPWWMGPPHQAWVLEAPRLLPFRPVRGRLGLWALQ